MVAVDSNPERLEKIGRHGASLTLPCDVLSLRELKTAVRRFARERGIPSWRQRIFETSGTPEGQETAFGLLAPGGILTVIGYTPKDTELRLSNLTALDAGIQGNWGCIPQHYPAAIDLVLSGKVAGTRPFVEPADLSQAQSTRSVWAARACAATAR